MILFLGFIETILRQKQELLIPNWGYLIPLRHCNSKTFLTSGCLSTNQAREEGFLEEHYLRRIFCVVPLLIRTMFSPRCSSLSLRPSVE